MNINEVIENKLNLKQIIGELDKVLPDEAFHMMIWESDYENKVLHDIRDYVDDNLCSELKLAYHVFLSDNLDVLVN